MAGLEEDVDFYAFERGDGLFVLLMIPGNEEEEEEEEEEDDPYYYGDFSEYDDSGWDNDNDNFDDDPVEEVPF